jgi:hypothetical protein
VTNPAGEQARAYRPQGFGRDNSITIGGNEKPCGQDEQDEQDWQSALEGLCIKTRSILSIL